MSLTGLPQEVLSLIYREIGRPSSSDNYLARVSCKCAPPMEKYINKDFSLCD
jgi:hypothetical protein